MITHAVHSPRRIACEAAGTSAVAATLLLIVLAACLSSVAGAQMLRDEEPSTLESSVDTRTSAGDDFFAYANGRWIESAEIPAGTNHWNARDAIDLIARQRVATLLDDARTAKPGTTARKVADFRTAYLNEAAIESRGLAPLRPLLDSIDRVQDRAGLTRLLGALMRADVDPLNWGVYESSQPLGLSVEESIHGEKRYVAFLLEGGLGLPDRENYVSNEPALRALRARYQEYVGGQLARAGFDHAEERAQGVMALETAISMTHATGEASANDHNADRRWSRADFAHEAPGMDWSSFFSAAGLTRQDSFVAWQPSAITGLAALVTSQPLALWKDYLRFHVIDRYADVLPRALAESAQAMRAAESGAQPASTRSQRASEVTQRAMSEAIGRMYAERYFPAAQKARVRAIVANVTAAFARRVQAATWMRPATKAIALAKVKSLYVGIGYPDRWQDFADLTVDSGDALGNLRRVENRSYRRALARVGQPIDRTEWWMAPQSVGALLVFQLNSYVFTAALLQPPKFDPSASDAALYGSIGAILGHDVSHYVDVLGAEYDADGAMRRWWTAEDSAHFAALADPLVKQFSAYRPFPDAVMDGRVALTENIADLAGLTSAFDAYHQSLGTRAADKAYVRRQDREFFLAFAQSWRTRMSEAALRSQVAKDHAPEPFRVATVRNMDAWYDAFDVHPGDKLYLAPGARVKIW